MDNKHFTGRPVVIILTDNPLYCHKGFPDSMLETWTIQTIKDSIFENHTMDFFTCEMCLTDHGLQQSVHQPPPLSEAITKQSETPGFQKDWNVTLWPAVNQENSSPAPFKKKVQSSDQFLPGG